MSHLADKECSDCTVGTTALKGLALAPLKAALSARWDIVGEHHLEREWVFPNFREALAFTNQVGELAEQQGHHPDIFLAWGKVRLTIWTHSAGGLTESDFVFAAKVDRIRGG